MVESFQRRPDSILLSHLKVLSEVLVSAPPVGPHHADSLVPSHLMEVRVSHVVLLSINREPSVLMRRVVNPVGLSVHPSPLLGHLLLLYAQMLVRIRRYLLFFITI